MEKLLIIDDSIPFLKDISLLLQKKYKVTTAINGKEGIEQIKKGNFTAVLLDIKMPDMTGLDVLNSLNSQMIKYPPIIIVSDSGEIETVVNSIRLGAYDYIQKDFNIEILSQKIKNALERNDLNNKVEYLNSLFSTQQNNFIFRSESMNKINEAIDKYSKIDCDILLKGETGVGKDLIAYEIFRRSNIKNKIFIPIPLSSINEQLLESELFGYEKGAFTGADKSMIGKFQTADNGTIYLPEISSISEAIQLKLLQFFQYKTINKVGSSGDEQKLNLRIISATNENLEEKVKQGKMRSDFYYRIGTIVIDIPSLRDRREDIEPLSKYFIAKHSKRLLNRDLSIEKSAIKFLESQNWFGNVRELENYLIKTIVQIKDDSDTVSSSNISSVSNINEKSHYDFHKNLKYDDAKRDFKLRYFNELLERSDKNLTKAAEIAGISRTGLDKALKEIGLK
ncbi:MAG: sigma-54 dependent transcriptional regulator [Ignavibacteriaceae bacterium]|jgi:DNA-binding NtrC family response regulator|nr:sigma-54 dependent transcriptional regulator [Ignavibacteriaceae bacterium]